MPLIETKGAASAQGFGLTLSSGGVTYIEDVFSTWLYQGTSANQTITNGIDLSTKGGLVWCKGRPNPGYSHRLFDTARGVNNSIATDSTDAQFTQTNSVTAFNTTGFSLGTDANGEVNFSGSTYVSWTFRKQPKFFDIVTYTGDGASNNTISHSLGSIPGCVIVKKTSGAAAWPVWHRTFTTDQFMLLNATNVVDIGTGVWGTSGFTSTSFSVGTSNSEWNQSGQTYVAYLFAHNAGGFGLSGTDNVISCGGTALNASGFATVSLGYEPQFVMIKSAQFDGDWAIYDTMRGAVALKSSDLFSAFSAQKLIANSSAAESTATDYTIAPSSTGFTLSATGYAGAAYDDFIYIAIRRGPMKVPTSGTSVFSPILSNASSGTTLTTGFPIDLQFIKQPSLADNWYWFDRLRGANSPGLNNGSPRLSSNSTSAEQTDFNSTAAWANTSFNMAAGWAGTNTDFCNFRRAPGFFDVVCYTGTGVARTVNHNLGAVPEMMIVKDRAGAGAGNDWAVYVSSVGPTGYLTLNANLEARTVAGGYTKNPWNSTTPTSTVFSVKTDSSVNFNGFTYVAYLFATCPGVSKVGSYTGNGSSQTINCGFTGGARFVLIKRTDSTGDWYVWDTARGIVAGNDPHLSLNSTAAEVTTNDSIDTDSTGFIVNQLAATNINVSSATYIFLAIA